MTTASLLGGNCGVMRACWFPVPLIPRSRKGATSSAVGYNAIYCVPVMKFGWLSGGRMAIKSVISLNILEEKGFQAFYIEFVI